MVEALDHGGLAEPSQQGRISELYQVERLD